MCRRRGPAIAVGAPLTLDPNRFARIADVMVDKVGSYMIVNILISLIAAGIKVLLSERLQTRDAADADAGADGETAPQPGQARSPTQPPSDPAHPPNGRAALRPETVIGR
jgi:hypothetical protein